ncbi:hypothetical protein H6G65_08150 [Microcystis elabens FACHB-917]|nr:hypothetical protein [Microcystis elabens FACHB-917]
MRAIRQGQHLLLIITAVPLVAAADGGFFAPPASAALDFGFSFAGVEGVIEGLVDNSIRQPTSVNVIGGAGVPADSIGTYIQIEGTGFRVSAGQVVGYLPPDPAPGMPPTIMFSTYFHGQNSSGHRLFFGTHPESPDLISGTLSGVPSDPWLPFGGVVTLQQRPSASVPAPLPLAGCAATFSYSRMLRQRRKVKKQHHHHVVDGMS